MKIKIALFLALGLFFACKKEKKEEEVKTASQVENLIKAGNWNEYDVSFTFGTTGSGGIGYRECTDDDYFVFADGSAYTVFEGADICDPTSAETGTWSLSSDHKEFTMDATTFDVIKLTKDTLKLYVEREEEGRGLTKYTYSYKNIK